MAKFKLDVICDWSSYLEQDATREDGFFTALRLLREQGWDVRFFRLGKEGVMHHPCVPIFTKPTEEDIAKDILENKPDAILFFKDFTSRTIEFLEGKGIPIAICLTGGTFREHLDAYQLVFVENKVYKDEFERLGMPVIQAFGVNTDIFKPIKQPKVWDAIYPATFALWKRHSIFSGAVGDKGLAVGLMYDTHEQECWEYCQKYGTAIVPHVSHRAVSYLMNMSHTCVIMAEAIGGSQRTVLEAMACNIPVIVAEDSDKTTEYVREAGEGAIVEPAPVKIREAIWELRGKQMNTREYVLENYSAEIYARKLKEGILSIV